MQEDEWTPCQLCGRHVPRRLITLHHLTPKQKGGKAEDRTPLCRPCHKQIHATFSNTELAQAFPTLQSLREAPLLQPFIRWIRRQKPDRNFKTMTARTHPSRPRAGWRRAR